MNKEHVIKKEDYTDEKYKVITFKSEKGDSKRAVALNDSICILPFDMNENGQIKNVYLHSFHDYITERPNKKCITRTLHPDEFDTYHNSLVSCIGDELGIMKIEPNAVYYLGNIQHGSPFHKTYKAYAINLNDYYEEPSGFSYSKEGERHSLDKVKLSRIVNGEISDSLILSCTLLLLSYISE